ncbi:hypothetical protein DD594_26235, partial [Enterobacter cloacae complex sp. 4DZ1-17B1]
MCNQDEQALAILLNWLDDKFLYYLDACTTAHEAWISLERHFGVI